MAVNINRNRQGCGYIFLVVLYSSIIFVALYRQIHFSRAALARGLTL